MVGGGRVNTDKPTKVWVGCLRGAQGNGWGWNSPCVQVVFAAVGRVGWDHLWRERETGREGLSGLTWGNPDLETGKGERSVNKTQRKRNLRATPEPTVSPPTSTTEGPHPPLSFRWSFRFPETIRTHLD